jgi:hypothetical protein
MLRNGNKFRLGSPANKQHWQSIKGAHKRKEQASHAEMFKKEQVLFLYPSLSSGVAN